MPAHPEVGNNFACMPTIIRNTPTCLIPKELFKEEKIRDYWSVVDAATHHESIGKDDLENSFLLYPKPKDADTVHEITLIYKDLQEKFPDQVHAICINVYVDGFCLLALKDRQITYIGHSQYTVKEDVLYHLANVFQQFFENIAKVNFFYQQLPSDILRLLNNYYEMKKL